MASSTRRTLFIIFIVIIAAGFAGAVFAQRPNSTATAGDAEENLKTFSTIYSIVEQNYADPVNPDKAIYNGAIPGMLHALDPHSNFFDPKNYSLLREDQQ